MVQIWEAKEVMSVLFRRQALPKKENVEPLSSSRYIPSIGRISGLSRFSTCSPRNSEIRRGWLAGRPLFYFDAY